MILVTPEHCPWFPPAPYLEVLAEASNNYPDGIPAYVG